MSFKKKLISVITCLFMLATLSFNVVACGGCSHQWGTWKVVTKATCTAEGVKEHTCLECGEVETASIAIAEHDYKEKVTTPETLVSEATCSSRAIYYYSCACGKISDTKTFKSGYNKEHDFVIETVSEATFKSEATCLSPALYYKSCACGKISDTETFEYGNLGNHKYTEKVPSATALKTKETSTKPAVYYKSCICGKSGSTETFEYKNVLIFGDSYSAYFSTLPSGYNPYYKGDNILTSPDQMWFSLLFKETGYNLLRNDSRSGSAISFTGYKTDGVFGDWSNSPYSFINRLKSLVSSGFFKQNRVDVVYIFGGTNDSWIGGELGEEMYSGWTTQDLFKALPAICYFYMQVREALPNAEIYGIANCGLKQQIIDAIANASEFVDGKAVLLKNIQTTSSHPTANGMEQICEQILAVMNN